MNRGHHGDSAGNRVDCELKSRRSSHHVFDAAGENVHYYSDSESLGSKKNKTRYINPAIYVEPADSSHSSTTSLQTDQSLYNLTPHPHGLTCRSNSTPFLTSRVTTATPSTKRKSCRLGEDFAATAGRTSRERSPRTSRTYREDGNDTFRLSVASVSTTDTAKEQHARDEQKKREAFKAWLARKEQEKREKERLENRKRNATPAITPEQREEAFQQWMERKRLQEERRRAEELTKRFRESQRLERERMQRDREKEEKLAEWVRRKEEAIKAMKTREERRAARAAIEEEKRRAAGERAYRDWVRTSRHKPRPVPLNRGELSMRGSISEMYINPIPWQAT